MRVMMENATLFSDVEFIVGAEERSFLGLKAIFARASEVFSKMFFEAGFREQATGPRTIVHVADILPEAFEQLHRWVYDMDVVLTYGIVFDVLNVARKYMVEDLELLCREWVAEAARTADGALGLYAAAAGSSLVWASALFDRVESYCTATLESQLVANLPFDALTRLLSSEDLFVQDEAYVLKACRFWANSAATRGEDPATAWRRVADAEIIRFHLLESRMFAEELVIPGLLSQEHALKVFLAKAVENGSPREASLVSRLRGVMYGIKADDATSMIEALVELRNEDGYPRALSHCLVEGALGDSQHCSEWVSMWNELWGALRGSGLRDECVRATVDYCQCLFEDEPEPDSLVGVWTCPIDTVGLVRILCKLNDIRKLAVLPLIKVLEVLLARAEDGSRAVCGPAEAAQELVSHLDGVAVRCGHLTALHDLPFLRCRLATVQGVNLSCDSP